MSPHLHQPESSKVDWERMSRSIGSAWKKKKETYLNIENRNFQKQKKNTKKQQSGTGCFSKFFENGFKRKDIEAVL